MTSSFHVMDIKGNVSGSTTKAPSFIVRALILCYRVRTSNFPRSQKTKEKPGQNKIKDWFCRPETRYLYIILFATFHKWKRKRLFLVCLIWWKLLWKFGHIQVIFSLSPAARVYISFRIFPVLSNIFINLCKHARHILGHIYIFYYIFYFNILFFNL